MGKTISILSHTYLCLPTYSADQRMTQYWNELSDSERELIVSIDGDSSNDLRFSDSVRRYRSLETTARETYCILQEAEIIRIQRCVDAVRQCLV